MHRKLAVCARPSRRPWTSEGTRSPDRPHVDRQSMADSRRRARVAVVGLGGWTQGWHLPNLQHRDDASIVAVVDPAEQPGVGGCVPTLCEPTAAVAAKYGAKRFASIDAALADASLALDGVLVAVPHVHHAAVATKVLEAGLHLLVEKPMTADVAEARALLELSRARPAQCFLLNNTANWQAGTRAAAEAVASGKLGELRAVNCVFAAPLGWLFEGEAHASWHRPAAGMAGNGFGFGQFSHTFAWVYAVTQLTPKTVYAVLSKSAATGADLYDAVTITCTNGATISATGVGACPDKGFKVVGNWLFGTAGMLSYSGLAGSDNVQLEEGKASERDVAGAASGPRLEIWTNDGAHERGPPFEFEHLEQDGPGPGSLDAFVKACNGETFYEGAGPHIGLKAVATIEAIYRSAQAGGPVEVSDGCA